MNTKTCIGILLFIVWIGVPMPAYAQKTNPQKIFEQRLLPIFKSPNPSSCVQCHLAGVDLKDYILPSHEQTFLSLRDQGLIDLKKPRDSKILQLIQMGAEQKKGAALIHAKNRQAEYEAFAQWIEACSQDPKLRDAAPLPLAQLAKPGQPVEVIRHARGDRLLESFERNIWSMRFRCMSCHIEGTPQNVKLREKYSERVSWMKKEGAQATMDYLIRESKLIDVKAPEKSLLLSKPLNLVEHGGGKKFLMGDQGYKAFRTWLEDYAAIVNNKYTKAADLPKEPTHLLQFGSDTWLKITDTPPAWADKLLQVTLYAWDPAKQTWEDQPIATSDRGVFGKGRLWQHNLTLLALRNSPRAETWQKQAPALPPGRYLVKIHVDLEGRLAQDWQASLTERDFVAQAEVESRWPEGYGRMTVLPASQIKKVP